MQVRRFHKGRKDINKAPILCDGRTKLHSVVNGHAIFEAGKDGDQHTIYLFMSAEDIWSLLSVRDIMKAERAG